MLQEIIMTNYFDEEFSIRVDRIQNVFKWFTDDRNRLRDFFGINDEWKKPEFSSNFGEKSVKTLSDNLPFMIETNKLCMKWYIYMVRIWLLYKKEIQYTDKDVLKSQHKNI